MTVPDVMDDGARRRRRRAAAAGQLLALHGRGALDDAGRWDWRTLGELPSWCLAGDDERRRLQAACGLVFLGPILGMAIDGGGLRAARALVGAPALEAILDDALERFAAGAGTGAGDDDGAARDDAVALPASTGGGEDGGAARADTASLSASFEGTDEEVAARLLGIGAAVLHATLTERLERVLPMEALRAALGPGLGELERAVADGVLERAVRLSAGPGAGQGAGRGA